MGKYGEAGHYPYSSNKTTWGNEDDIYQVCLKSQVMPMLPCLKGALHPRVGFCFLNFLSCNAAQDKSK